ncbi:ornithine cyclodeaminase family protein [uncultured Jatrophihabitans sp.]|uniref:ornithine cyclodeaminase family protein n=1 Tax=uncultured Jatrophihabitans sp. TaxID=1610747 RepID=UPI0035CCA190
MTIRQLSGAQVRHHLPMTDAIVAVRQAFVGLAADEFDMPLRTALGDGAFLIMTARHRPTASIAVKSLTIDFNRRPAIQGVVTWAATTGSELLVVDAAEVTTLRTGAVVGVATDLLCRDDASTLVLIGLGELAPDQLRAVRAVRPIRNVILVATDLARAEAFRSRHAVELADLEVTVTTDADTAVSAADVICCATPVREPLFQTDALPARVHVNAVGSYRPSMRELPDGLLATATVVVDLRAAALAEAGEIRHAVASAALDETALIELGPALDGQLDLGPRTVFKSVGLAIQDWAIVHSLASRTADVGTLESLT